MIEVMQTRSENRGMHDEIVGLLKESNSGGMSKKTVRRERIKGILQPSVSPQDTYDKIRKAYLTGTGEWVCEEKYFQSWVNKTFPVLWVSGIPGAGKSFLSSAMISYLKEQYPAGVHDGAQVSLGYFFFKDDDLSTRSYHQALRDLAFQICSNDPVYANYIESVCGSCNDVETLGSAWRVLFREYYVENDTVDSTVYLIMDGIDEAYDAERSEFLNLLQDLWLDAPGGSRIQLVMVGRPHIIGPICDALQIDTVPTIHVDATKNSEDIRNYIQNSIRKSRVLKRVSNELQDEVVESLSDRANGMFLWVDLMMRELSGKSRESTIREALRKAPKGLPEMIQHVLEGLSESLSEEDAEDLNETLAWVTCAKRPLKLGELDAILRYNSPTGDGLLMLESNLRRQWASFFTLAREDGLTTADLQNVEMDVYEYDDEVIYDQEEAHSFEDVEVDFDSSPSTTEVTFCHASIGDFFRDERQTKVQSKGGPPIGVNINSANFSTLSTVFKLATDEEFEEKVKDGNFFEDYAADNWSAHLRDTDITKTTAEDKGVLGPMLIKFCRDEPTVENSKNYFMSFYDRWAGDCIALFRVWLDDKELLGTLPPRDQDWVKSTFERPASTFKEVARMHARLWLQWMHTNNNPYLFCRSIFWYRQSMDGTPLDYSKRRFDNAGIIKESAEWAGFEETALWHRRVAIAYEFSSYFDEAQTHFQKARELDPKQWGIRSGLATVYMHRKDFPESLKLLQEEIAVVKGDPYQQPDGEDVLASTFTALGDCFLKLAEPEKACNAFLEAWNTSPKSHNALAGCFSYFDEADRFRDAMNLIKKMVKVKIADSKTPCLVIYMTAREFNESDIFFSASRRAARATGEMPYLIETVQEAITFCRNNRRTVDAILFELFLADIYYIDRVNSERGIRIWERVVGTANKELRGLFAWYRTESSLAQAQTSAENKLSQYYFDRANETKGTLKCTEYVQRLERLGKSKGRAGETIRLTASSIILGIWYTLNGEPNKAFTCFQAHIKHAMQILSDDDPDNDIEGYRQISSALFSSGEYQRAMGAWRKVSSMSWRLTHGLSAFRTEEEEQQAASGNKSTTTSKGPGEGGSRETEQEVDEIAEDKAGDKSKMLGNDDDTWDQGIVCDGACSPARRFKQSDALWLCRYCFDLAFCDACLALLKQDKLPVNICSPHHEWLPVPLTVQYVPADKMFISAEGDEMMDMDQWKREIRETWKF